MIDIRAAEAVLRLVYELTIIQRGLSSEQTRESIVLFRVLHTLSARVVLRHEDLATISEHYQRMCELDFDGLVIAEDLRRLRNILK